VRFSSSAKPLVSACLGALLASACASATPPPRFSATSPAEASAPESPLPPAQPILTGSGELADPAPDAAPKPDAPPSHGHHHHPPEVSEPKP
jgi:hypothetical protein